MADLNAILNNSYGQGKDAYTVVKKGDGYTILRVNDASLYARYWREFVSADYTVTPEISPMYLKIEQVPPAVTLIDQFAPFIPELPIVYLETDGRHVNISSKVTTNIPNTEVPGLFRLDYRIDLDEKLASIFWTAYVSIQQRPLLRKAAAGWVRDSYIIKTLNRLVMEPQFMEALHAAGEPLYGFMQANQHPSIRAARLPMYAGVQAWGAGKTVEADTTNTIFVTGLKLPQGSVIVFRRRMLQLQEPVFPDTAGADAHMNAETHTRSKNAYEMGAVRRIGQTSYICIKDADETISLDNEEYWHKGYLYRFSLLGEESVIIPDGRLPIGRGGVEHIWVTVDNQGYPFWVDIAHATAVGTYRGHYSKNNFADYNADDMVSFVNENSIRLFSRKRTDIQDESTLIYPPGHYLNPAWEEVYCHMEGEYSPLLSDYYIVPHTNATNAIVAKTWSVSEEICTAYAHLVGIPQSIMNECGAKWSALLFALIVRTRNTFDGFRMCLRAVGLDVSNLVLSEPSIAYFCRPEGADAEAEVKDIYTQHENLRALAARIFTLEPSGQWKEKEGCLRYRPKDDGTADPECTEIQQYTNNEWVTRYKFERIDPVQNYNNRYYDCDLNVLARLAADAVKDLGDGKTWVKAPAWTGAYSALVADVISYEIPIYVWVRIHMCLYDEAIINMDTAVFSKALDAQRCGGKNTIELFPSRYFSRALHDYVEIETGVFELSGDTWREIEPTRRNAERGSKIYEFDSVKYPIRIRAVDTDSNVFIHYWQSTHTFGLLGLASSSSTDRFINVTSPEVTDESDLMLANGYVGVTALYRPKGLYAYEVKALRWMYVLGETSEEETWQLSETEPFVDLHEISKDDVYPFEGSLDDFKMELASIRTAPIGGQPISFEWDGDYLLLKDAMPEILYCQNADGDVLSMIRLRRESYTLTQADIDENRGPNPLQTVRISFAYA